MRPSSWIGSVKLAGMQVKSGPSDCQVRYPSSCLLEVPGGCSFAEFFALVRASVLLFVSVSFLVSLNNDPPIS